ncbi:MAG: pyrroline-5-carboxylate reductase [Verrucomicrobiota bacterium JB023]|nr:pyrroline-5-carboxylate reductase [Verrucomicrobiota bacterium JB023]
MKIGLIGCGRMGRALIEGAIRAGTVKPEDVLAYDIHRPTVEKLVHDQGITGTHSISELAEGSEAILLCTKPGDVAGALSEVADATPGDGEKLLISVAAGVTMAQLEAHTAGKARVIRSMPNTPALVGQGAAAFTTGIGVTEDDEAFASRLFGSVGQVVTVPEKLMDAVTGLSGSGPAFVYLFIEALADGAVASGLPRDQALALATQTVLGAATMVKETGLHPGLLKDMVTSPGGTTIRGIEALESNAFRSAAIQAVRASSERSIELGKS